MHVLGSKFKHQQYKHYECLINTGHRKVIIGSLSVYYVVLVLFITSPVTL